MQASESVIDIAVVIGDIAVVNDGSELQAESVTAHDIKLPELQVEEVASQRDMLADCTAPRDDNHFTSVTVIQDKSGMGEEGISNGNVSPSIEHANTVVRELEASADEPQEACAGDQGDLLAENTSRSSPELVQHSSDASVPVHTTNDSESGTKQDVSNDMIPCNDAIVMENLTEFSALEAVSYTHLTLPTNREV